MLGMPKTCNSMSHASRALSPASGQAQQMHGLGRILALNKRNHACSPRCRRNVQREDSMLKDTLLENCSSPHPAAQDLAHWEPSSLKS